jgi:hypothetical protein
MHSTNQADCTKQVANNHQEPFHWQTIHTMPCPTKTDPNQYLDLTKMTFERLLQMLVDNEPGKEPMMPSSQSELSKTRAARLALHWIQYLLFLDKTAYTRRITHQACQSISRLHEVAAERLLPISSCPRRPYQRRRLTDHSCPLQNSAAPTSIKRHRPRPKLRQLSSRAMFVFHKNSLPKNKIMACELLKMMTLLIVLMLVIDDDIECEPSCIDREKKCYGQHIETGQNQRVIENMIMPIRQSLVEHGYWK